MAQNLHDLLTGKMLGLTKPNIIFCLVAVAIILTVLVITLVVRTRQGRLTSSSGKFTNPLKNINVIMAMVWLVFICFDFILDTLVHLGITLPYLLFLNFPQGKHQVAGQSCKKHYKQAIQTCKFFPTNAIFHSFGLLNLYCFIKPIPTI